MKQQQLPLATTILAIDPGISGGMVSVTADCFAVPIAFTGEADALRWLRSFDPNFTTAWMEDVHSSPQMGVRSAFTFGRNVGFWIGAIGACAIPLRSVKPQQWQRGIPGLSGKQGTLRKNALKAEAARRFPQFKVSLATADALLLADWARTQMTQTTSYHA